MKRIIIKFSYPGALKSWFILGAELFHKKAYCIFSSSFTTYFGAVVINDWKTIFDIAIVLRITIFSSSVRFLMFHIFNTSWISVAVLKIFFPLSIFYCKRSEYLIFFTCHYLDLYNAYHMVLLEPLSGLQYSQFQIFLNLVLIRKSTNKTQKCQPYAL